MIHIFLDMTTTAAAEVGTGASTANHRLSSSCGLPPRTQLDCYLLKGLKNFLMEMRCRTRSTEHWCRPGSPECCKRTQAFSNNMCLERHHALGVGRGTVSVATSLGLSEHAAWDRAESLENSVCCLRLHMQLQHEVAAEEQRTRGRRTAPGTPSCKTPHAWLSISVL